MRIQLYKNSLKTLLIYKIFEIYNNQFNVTFYKNDEYIIYTY